MELNNILKNRKSCRNFKDELIDEKKIQKLVEAFKLAPNSCNLQLSKLILVNDSKILKDFEKKVTGKISWTNQLFVLIIDNNINVKRHAHYISAGMSVENLILKAEELGISTCPIAGFSNQEYIKKKLNIPKKYDVPLLIFFGYNNQKKEISNHNTYKTNDILSTNFFDFDFDFPKTSNFNLWSKKQILEYRKRIMSVYYPRLSHGTWRNSLNNEYEAFVKRNKFKKSLTYFMWERNFLNLKKNNSSITISDYDTSYLEFLNKNYEYNIHEINSKNSETYNEILIANSLEFQPDLEEIIKDLSLKKFKKATIIIFSYYGIFSLFYRFGQKIDYLNNVYEKNPFYKIGPIRFIKKKEFLNILDKYDLKVNNESYLKSSLLNDKFKNKYIKKILNILNNFFPENIKLEIQKK